MRAEAIQTSLYQLIKAQIPVFVWGSPGIGKSSIVKQVALQQGLEFLDLRLSLLDPTDLKGIPFFDQEHHRAVWASPSFLPSDPDSCGILFLDEINTAPPSVQASAYQLVLDRKVGEYELPKGWSIVAAGNNESDRGVVYRMPPPLANRFVHLEMEVDFEEWKRWAYRVGIDSTLIAFLHYDPSHLFAFDPSKNQKSFPTPRSWEYVHRILSTGVEGEILMDLVSGAVGEESATALMSFRKVMHRLPNIEALLEGSEEPIDEDPLVLFALSAGIVARLQTDLDPQKVDHALLVALRLPKEFSVMLVKDLQQNNVALERSKYWEQWVEAFAYLLV